MQRRLQFFIQFPEYLALFKGDMYLKAKDAEEFRGALARCLFLPVATESPGGGQDAVPRPVGFPPDAAAVDAPAAVPGLREIVAAVMVIVAEMTMPRPPVGAAPGLTQVAAPPVGPAVPWTPPVRPGPTGPTSAIRRTFYDLLSRG